MEVFHNYVFESLEKPTLVSLWFLKFYVMCSDEFDFSGVIQNEIFFVEGTVSV